MGRPVSQTPGEIRGTLERAAYMISIAESSLADVSLADTDKPGFRRFIKRVPLGTVLVIAPWKYVPALSHPPSLLTQRSYPYLTSINSVLPALIAGNSIILKPSPQTPLAAERFALAWTRAELPVDLLQVAHLSPGLAAFAVAHPKVDFVSFTGSVAGGKVVAQAAAGSGFTGVALEVRPLCGLWAVRSELAMRVCSSVGRTRRMFVRMQNSTILLLNW